METTVDNNEVEHFAKMADEWWNPNGLWKFLHAYNNCRVPWFTNCLLKFGALKTNNDDKILNRMSLLDVGCGGGFLSEALARLGGDVIGIDPTSDLIKVAQYHADATNLSNVRYECASILEHASQNKEKYDVVISSESIEHVDDQKEFVKYCAHCLKPGGSIFITTPSKTWLSKMFLIFLMEDVFYFIPKGTHSYDKFIDIEDLSNLLKHENCDIVETTGVMANPWANKWFLSENKKFFYAIHAVKRAS